MFSRDAEAERAKDYHFRACDKLKMANVAIKMKVDKLIVRQVAVH